MPGALAEDIDARVDALFARYKVVGGSVVVAREGQLVYARDWGVRSLAAGDPVGEDTFFRIASVTKLVSAIGLMQQVERGTLALDAPIGEVLGYAAASPRFPDTPLTLRQLMSHTASLTSGNGFSVGGRTLEQIIGLQSGKAGYYTHRRPGRAYRYSNLGAGVTSALLEAVTGQSMDAYMRAHVFEPLGIQAAYAASRIAQPQHLSDQHQDGRLLHTADSFIQNGYEDFADPQRHYDTAYGGLWIPTRDLARLGIALAGDGTVEGVRLLQPASLLEMQANQAQAGASVQADSPYGLFLERTNTALPGHTLFGHQGILNGVSANLYFEPDTGFVFTLATNGGSTARQGGVTRLARALIKELYGPLIEDARPQPVN